MTTATTLVIIGALGAVGALIRLGLHHLATWRGASPVYATVVANVLGSCGAGLVLAGEWGEWSWLLAAGLFGATSTLSTLAVDVAELLRRKGMAWLTLLTWHTLGGLTGFGLGYLLGVLS